MTFDASKLTVLAITAPQPSLKAREMTFRFVPGGPEPMIKGLGSLRPSTIVLSLGIMYCLFNQLHSNNSPISRIYTRKAVHATIIFQAKNKELTGDYRSQVWS